MKPKEVLSKVAETTAPHRKALGCGAQVALFTTGFACASLALIDTTWKLVDSIQTVRELDSVDQNLSALNELLERNRRLVELPVNYHYLAAQEACLQDHDQNEVATQIAEAETAIKELGCTSLIKWKCTEDKFEGHKDTVVSRDPNGKWWIGTRDFDCPGTFQGFLNSYHPKK